MSDNEKTSYIENEDGDVVAVRHTYEHDGRYRDCTFAVDTGIFGLLEEGELLDTTDHYEDGTSESYAPGEEHWIW